MEIVVVANNEDKLKDILEKIKHIAGVISLHSYTDPMLAVKFICNHEVDFVFADATLKYLTGIDLIRILHKKYPDMDISIMTEDTELKNYLLSVGAKRVLVKPVAVDTLQKIVETYKKESG